MKEFDQMMQNEGQDQMVYTDGERQRFAYIGKWLGRLFWLMILSNIPALATEKWVLQNFPLLYWMGQALTLVSLMGIGVILLMLSRAHAFTGGKTVPCGRHLSADCWGGKLGTEHSGRC